MPIKIIKSFQWSPNGYEVATVEAGEYESLPGRAAEIAVQLGATDSRSEGGEGEGAQSDAGRRRTRRPAGAGNA